MTTRQCTVCHIRETEAFPFGDSDHCPKHHWMAATPRPDLSAALRPNPTHRHTDDSTCPECCPTPISDADTADQVTALRIRSLAMLAATSKGPR